MSGKYLAILLATGSLAFGLVALAPERAEAAPINAATKAFCLAGGWQWSDALGCAFNNCTLNGTEYEPGDDVYVNGKTYYCDGFTGRWTEVIKRPPTSNLPKLKLSYY